MKKETKKLPAKQVTKKIVKAELKENSKLMWAGGAKLLEKSESKDVQKQKNAILVMSSVMGVSPFGINILGGVAYINKLGRKQKLKQYGNDEWAVEYRWVQRALNDTDKAICEARVIEKKTRKPLGEWAVGECSPASMKMSTLAGYQNHNAQTRAHNRAIEEFIGEKIHEEMVINLAKMQLSKNEKLPMLDTGVSAEEINTYQKPQKAQREEVVEYPEYECHECANPMNENQVKFSERMFGKRLCKQCQELAKKGQVRGVR